MTTMTMMTMTILLMMTQLTTKITNFNNKIGIARSVPADSRMLLAYKQTKGHLEDGFELEQQAGKHQQPERTEIASTAQ